MSINAPSSTTYSVPTPVVGAASDATGPAVNGIKRGFLSCLRQVVNSLVIMKDAVVSGLERMSKFNYSATKQTVEAKTPTGNLKSAINPVSGELTDKVCTVLRDMIIKDPAYVQGMFRRSGGMKPGELNAILKGPETELLRKIQDKEISGLDMGRLIMNWFRDVIGDNKFSHAEVLKINQGAVKDIDTVVERLFNRLRHGDQKQYAKCISLLSVFNEYQKVCVNDNITLQEVDSSVIPRLCIPALCDMSHKTPETIYDVSDELAAVEKVLKHFAERYAESTRAVEALNPENLDEHKLVYVTLDWTSGKPVPQPLGGDGPIYANIDEVNGKPVSQPLDRDGPIYATIDELRGKPVSQSLYEDEYIYADVYEVHGKPVSQSHDEDGPIYANIDNVNGKPVSQPLSEKWAQEVFTTTLARINTQPGLFKR